MRNMTERRRALSMCCFAQAVKTTPPFAALKAELTEQVRDEVRASQALA